MVNSYPRGQSDLRALSLLEELKYVLLQQDHQIAKQSIEIERLNKENEHLRGEVTRLKEEPIWYDPDAMSVNSSPTSPETERKKKESTSMGSDRGDKSDEDESNEPKHLVPKMIFRLNKEKDEDPKESKPVQAKAQAEIAEVINPLHIKEAKNIIASKIYEQTNKPPTFVQQNQEMSKAPIQYDPATARQNPQAPPTLAVPSNDDLNNQIQNQMTAYTHREQRRQSFSRPPGNPQYPPQTNPMHQNPSDPYQNYPVQGQDQTNQNDYLVDEHIDNNYPQYNQYQDFSNGNQQVFGNWQHSQLTPDVYAGHPQMATTPNSTTSSNGDEGALRPARRLNENCKCQFCGKLFQSSWHLKRHERTHTNERPFNCNNCGKSFSDNSNYCKHQRKCNPMAQYPHGVPPCDILSQPFNPTDGNDA